MTQFIKRTTYFILFTLMFSQISLAQSVKRQSIGSYGTSGVTNSTISGQTVGQPYATNSYNSDVISLTPGFQQPVSYNRDRPNPVLEIIALKVFPNPAIHNFTIKSQELLENVEIQVSDINGRLILNDQLSKLTSHSINCSTWQSSMYFITVASEDLQFRYSTKLIITNH